MRVQTRSATFKPGEPMDHMMAVQRIRAIFNVLGKNGLHMDENVPLQLFIDQLPDNRVYSQHKADLGIFDFVVDMDYGLDANVPKNRLLAIIEIHGDVGFWYMDPITGKKAKANPTRHSKPAQIRNDKLVKNYCETNGIKYIVLKKEEVLGDCTHENYISTSFKQIRKELKEFLK